MKTLLCVNNEQLLTREDVKQATQQTMTGENWIMSDFNVKFEDKHHSVEEGDLSERRERADEDRQR